MNQFRRAEPGPLLIASQENDWIDHLGQAQPHTPIARILCLKFDHIGDMLVADLALRLLRDYFPHAHITLLCGPWNVGLSERLAIADRVIGVDLFNEAGAEQHDPAAAALKRDAGLQQIAAMQLGPFDLAVDLRVDEDTRDLLRLFNARIRAGIGELRNYPFLDIAVPPFRESANEGLSFFTLMPGDFVAGDGFAVGRYGLSFTASRSRITLDFEITGAKTPMQCGTSRYDDRLLGVGVQRIELFGIRDDVGSAEGRRASLLEARFSEGSSDIAFLESGWAAPEDFGTWTVAPKATLFLPVAIRSGFSGIEVVVDFISHTNVANPEIGLRIVDRQTWCEIRQVCTSEPKEQQVTLRSYPTSASMHARSRPFAVKAGCYRTTVEAFISGGTVAHSLCCRVVDTLFERSISEQVVAVPAGVSGKVSLEFEFTVTDPKARIEVEIGCLSPQSVEGLSIISVHGQCAIPVPPKLPVAHMEQRLAHLVFAIALNFSDRFDRLKSAAESLLAAGPSDEATPMTIVDRARHRLLRLRRQGKVLVGVGLGASKSTKRWPLAYFVTFCQSVLEHPATHLVCFGGPGDVAETDALVGFLDHPERITNLCGKTALARLGEIFSAIDLYIGYDTGTTHLAGKAGVRTFCVFAGTHNPREWGPVGRRTSWLMANVGCGPCYLAHVEECRFGHACMLQLQPGECWDAIRPYVDAVKHARRLENATGNGAGGPDVLEPGLAASQSADRD